MDKRSADLKSWCARPLWTLQEAAQLLCNEEPAAGLSERGGDAHQLYQTLRAAATATKTLPAAATTPQVLLEPVVVITWAVAKGFGFVPNELRQFDFYSARKSRDANGAEADAPPTLLRAFIAMAISGFDHKPAMSRSPATPRIREALHSVGLDVDPNTIRKWLRAGAELLPSKQAALGAALRDATGKKRR